MKIVCLVIDSFGIGAAPDAKKYGDLGSNTAVHIAEAVGKALWPNLQKMGLGNAAALLNQEIPGCPPEESSSAAVSVLREISEGKDTTTGHWELAGITLPKAFYTFPKMFPSFPKELVTQFEKEIGRKTIGNLAASGTAIIEELGDEHVKTGFPIIYTSSDSVFQIAAHEEVIPIEQLYEFCTIARRLCDKYNVGRVIARPFIGESGNFTRTVRRHDYSIDLPGPTILDHLQSNNIETIGIGKIGDIFNNQGIGSSYPDKGNAACIERLKTILQSKNKSKQFIFVNLVDTDMIYGHRRDPKGYHDAVTEVDKELGSLLPILKEDDSLLITADHGCDPTYKGTDHTREYVPFLHYMFNQSPTDKKPLIRDGFFYMSRLISSLFSIPKFPDEKQT